jgi:hypothetical protein
MLALATERSMEFKAPPLESNGIRAVTEQIAAKVMYNVKT